jgi:hypothetical protein
MFAMSKAVITRRLTVPILPLQWEFPGHDINGVNEHWALVADIAADLS